VIRAVADAGLSVPGDLSVVGFDDIQIAQHMHPPLTTLAQDKPGLGVAAARALLRQVEGAEAAEPVTLPVELVLRSSTTALGG
jgi:LacI family transcriptional regulator